jgi:RimJ/RimL family protein N-acetyltransferase
MGLLQPPELPLTDGVVVLRLLREEDVAPMITHCRDPQMQRWTTVPTSYEEKDAREWLRLAAKRWANGEAAVFAIADAFTGQYLGGIDLCSGPWPVGEIGYGVKPEARGRGVATRALRLLARWALDELELARVELITDVDNIASQRVAEKAGFVREGTLRQRLEVKGRRSDCVMYSMLADDLS